MKLMSNKPASIQASESNNMEKKYTKPTWTIDEVIADCKVSKKALQVIANLKAVLVTEDLCTEFMLRITFDPTGLDMNRLVRKMREEQLQANPMSDESFMDMYLLNPLQALIQYFKHSVVLAHIDRIKQWNIDIKDVMEIKKKDNTIHFDRALMALYK